MWQRRPTPSLRAQSIGRGNGLPQGQQRVLYTSLVILNSVQLLTVNSPATLATEVLIERQRARGCVPSAHERSRRAGG